MIRRDLDWRSPLDVFQPLAGEPFACLLHAGAAAQPQGWSVLAAFPANTLTARRKIAYIDGLRSDDAPFEALQRFARSRRAAYTPTGSPFATGLIGFVGYEMGAALEPAAAGPASPFALPDLAFGAYDAAAVFDGERRRAFILGRSERAADRLREALGRGPAPEPLWRRPGPIGSTFSASAYREAVGAVIDRIRNGDLFQANLSQQLALEGRLDPFPVFRRLMAGDAQFGAFLQYPEGTIVSNSPERFFQARRRGSDLTILAEPIKGTRPRGANTEEDGRLAAELLADSKERAENVMIADLVRNDLSRVCRDGSVREEAVCALVSTVGVHHLVSRISGVLEPDLDAIDALKALFPSGSVTGAPKIEAMRVIAEFEKIGRGPYCGAIGYLDDRGDSDFSVAIRILVASAGRGVFPVGGGVTLRSDPEAEYLETLLKSRAMTGALGAESAVPR